jgi:hypothetical protein
MGTHEPVDSCTAGNGTLRTLWGDRCSFAFSPPGGDIGVLTEGQRAVVFPADDHHRQLGSFWPGRPKASELPVVESAASADLDPTAVAETNGLSGPRDLDRAVGGQVDTSVGLGGADDALVSRRRAGRSQAAAPQWPGP